MNWCCEQNSDRSTGQKNIETEAEEEPVHQYSSKLRAKVAKYACKNGNKAAVRKYSAELGYTLFEATVIS